MKPSFILSKGERRRADVYTLPEDLLAHYCDLYASRFIWDNMPDSIPEGWVERGLFWQGCIGAKEVGGVPFVLPAAGVTVDVYGHPLTWIPSLVQGTHVDVGVHAESDGPTCFLGFDPLAWDLRPFAITMSEALMSLRTNIIAMRTPVAVKGTPGCELQGAVTMSMYEEGKPYIPSIQGVNAHLAEVLDLGVTDYTQGLVNTVRAMDAEILTRMCIRNQGTGRESGVTALETDSISDRLEILMEEELRVRQRWADEVNARYGWGISVRKAEGWNDRQEQQDNDDDGTTSDGGADQDGAGAAQDR